MPVINKPPIGLTDQEILCVIAYLQTLGGTATVTLQTSHHYYTPPGAHRAGRRLRPLPPPPEPRQALRRLRTAPAHRQPRPVRLRRAGAPRRCRSTAAKVTR